MKRTILRDRRGVSTISSLLSLLLVFSILILLFLTFFSYNLAVQEQMRLEHERLQEEIAISGLVLNETDMTITHVVVNNTGTIEVKIRAIYTTNSTTTTFICDPSSYTEDAYIAPNDFLSISLEPEIAFEPDAKITVATERGVKTKEYEGVLVFGPSNPSWEYDPSRLYIGPLMLQFDAFWYRKTFQNGTLVPDEPWRPGWSISKGFGYCAWNITVMNIDDRNITLNRFSSFTAVPNDSPSNNLSWYLEPTNQTDLTQFLPVNQTRSIIYTWSTPKSFPEEGGTDSATKMTLPECTCMVFLTFYGIFHEHDGTTTTYAQTIPFEAAITVG